VLHKFKQSFNLSDDFTEIYWLRWEATDPQRANVRYFSRLENQPTWENNGTVMTWENNGTVITVHIQPECQAFEACEVLRTTDMEQLGQLTIEIPKPSCEPRPNCARQTRTWSNHQRNGETSTAWNQGPLRMTPLLRLCLQILCGWTLEKPPFELAFGCFGLNEILTQD